MSEPKSEPKSEPNPELERLRDLEELPSWRRWGPYLSDRQWGTVREDYSPTGDPWAYFPFSHAHRRAYRWGEDGIAGISDAGQRLCLALTLWNGRDSILKERLFGLGNEEGNHGEDVKELYYYLDATPTHSYLKMLYKYPQTQFPYQQLVEENRRRGRHDSEFEIIDTGVFDEDRYFDVFVEYAKAAPRDILLRVTAHNRGPEAAELHLLPTVWFRNTWSWGEDHLRPTIEPDEQALFLSHPEWDEYRFFYEGSPPILGGTRSLTPQPPLPGERGKRIYAPSPQGEGVGGEGGLSSQKASRNNSSPSDGLLSVLFTDNETDSPALFNSPATGSGFFKDAFHKYLIEGNKAALNPARTGTKVAPHYRFQVPPGESITIRCRLRHAAEPHSYPFADFDDVMAARIREADTYYSQIGPEIPDADARLVQRQAVAGLIWTKQFYEYDVYRWLKGDPSQPAPPPDRRHARNHEWAHLKASDILSMPDKWEYPYFCAWDTAFHAIALAPFDPEFAKDQLLLLTREWYCHPNGQLPAYEWNFSDANPPVHAWAVWRVFQIDRKSRQLLHDNPEPDWFFLERAYHKLMINFTWWVNRKDHLGRNVFQGGFLGLDNIGVFDRSQPLPTGGFINQADGTAWMAKYCLNMMRIGLELATHDRAYEEIAIKFFEHFLGIAKAMTDMAEKGIGLWDDEDGFYYDELSLPNGKEIPLKVRSLVGLIPLFAVEVLEPELLVQVPEFAARLRWVLDNRPDLASLVSRWFEPGRGERRLLSLLRGHRMKLVLKRLLDEAEFLSPYGVRGLSKVYQNSPYTFQIDHHTIVVRYMPGDSDSGMFGGNSNWRGPVWFPVNFLIIESLQKFHHYYGDDFLIEYPTGSGQQVTILQVAVELTRRLTQLFLRDSNGRRACLGPNEKFQTDPHFRDYIQFHEYFHGDTGMGLGASHQTGWTALVGKLLNPRQGGWLYTLICPPASAAKPQTPVGTGLAVGAPAVRR